MDGNAAVSPHKTEKKTIFMFEQMSLMGSAEPGKLLKIQPILLAQLNTKKS